MPDATLVNATLGEDGSIEPPLGPLYIAATLESVGWNIDFRDYQLASGADAFNSDRFVEFLGDHEPVLMISCLVDMMPMVLEASRKIKERRAATLIILGGPGPSASAPSLMRAFTQIDGIVMGEGEETVRHWALQYDSLHAPDSIDAKVAGMVYRCGERIVDGGQRDRIQSGVRMERPAYHLLDWAKYTGARVITTRGCPYKCSFCDVAPLWGRKAMYRDISETVDEMIFLRDRYGRNEIAIVDDTFVLNRKRVEEFCETLLECRAGLMWGCFGRINLMTEDLIALMARAGCRSIFYGIDSGSARMLSKVAKEIDRDSILPILDISAQYFDTVEASFIWGYPEESFDDFLQTLNLAAEASRFSPTVNVQLHLLSPLPSAPITKAFTGPLVAPIAGDKRWLLLPALLLDSRAVEVRKIVLSFPELFTGFYTFPSPDLNAKRELLEKVFSSLHRTLGTIMTDERVHALLSIQDRQTELELLASADDDADRIGIGLAIGTMQRVRRNTRSTMRGEAATCYRGPSIVRQRNDLGGQIGQ
jgi:anaerobic magnesium-protoporphyrin IX monomethyl ester cyclase